MISLEEVRPSLATLLVTFGRAFKATSRASFIQEDRHGVYNSPVLFGKPIEEMVAFTIIFNKFDLRTNGFDPDLVGCPPPLLLW